MIALVIILLIIQMVLVIVLAVVTLRHHQELVEILEDTPKTINFPTDATSSYPTQVKEYLDKYNLTPEICTRHLIMWSPYWERLCFPFFDDTGLIGWQGRSFNPDKPKWYSQGDLKSIIHILGNQKSQQLILTEDIISSIVLSQFTKYCASPPVWKPSRNRQTSKIQDTKL